MTDNTLPKQTVAKPFGRLLAPKTTNLDFKYSDFYLETAQHDIRFSLDHLDQYGTNEIAQEKSDYWFWHLLKTFWNPFILLLVPISVISFARDDIPGEQLSCS